MSTLNHDTELQKIITDIYDLGKTDATLHTSDFKTLQPGLEKALHTYLYKQTLELIGKDEPTQRESTWNNVPVSVPNYDGIQRNMHRIELRKAAAERWGQE